MISEPVLFKSVLPVLICAIDYSGALLFQILEVKLPLIVLSAACRFNKILTELSKELCDFS